MPPISSTRLKELQKPFILSCLREGVRVDGRGLIEARAVSFRFSFSERGHAEVTIGSTRVLCCVSGDVVRPRPDHPSEGQISFNVDLSPMASPDYDLYPAAGTITHETAAELTVLIESLLRKSRAVDTEALCVEGGLKVWSLKVDIRVLDDDGNIRDAAALAALAGLLHFRRKKEIEYRASNRDCERLPPTPLSIHHMPILVTLCFFDDGPLMTVDPTREEEAVSAGHISVAVNQFKELCAVKKSGGVPIPSDILRNAIHIASIRGVEVAKLLIESLKDHDSRREERRKNIWDTYGEETIPEAVSIRKSTIKETKTSNVEAEINKSLGNATAAAAGATQFKANLNKKRKKLLKQIKKFEAAARQVSDNDVLPSSESPPKTKVTEKVKASAQVVVVNTADKTGKNEFDAMDDAEGLFSQAVLKKSKKLKCKKGQ